MQQAGQGICEQTLCSCMNYAIVFRLLGYILMIEGTLLLLPAVTSLLYPSCSFTAAR